MPTHMQRFRALCVVVLALASAAVDARCTARDAWRGTDKQEHLAVGAAIANAATLQTGSAWKGFLWGAGIGLAKELIDSAGSGTCSLQDAAVTVLGASIGTQTGRLLLRVKRGGAAVIFTTDF